MTKPFKQRIADEWAFQRHGHNAELRSRPNFWQWLKVSWIDIATLLLTGGIAFGVCQEYACYYIALSNIDEVRQTLPSLSPPLQHHRPNHRIPCDPPNPRQRDSRHSLHRRTAHHLPHRTILASQLLESQ